MGFISRTNEVTLFTAQPAWGWGGDIRSSQVSHIHYYIYLMFCETRGNVLTRDHRVHIWLMFLGRETICYGAFDTWKLQNLHKKRGKGWNERQVVSWSHIKEIMIFFLWPLNTITDLTNGDFRLVGVIKRVRQLSLMRWQLSNIFVFKVAANHLELGIWNSLVVQIKPKMNTQRVLIEVFTHLR